MKRMAFVFVMIIDFTAMLLINLFSFLLRFDFQLPENFYYSFFLSFVSIALIKLSIMVISQGYKYIWEYAHVDDFLKIGIYIVIANMTILILRICNVFDMDYSVLIIMFILDVSYFIGSRVLLKLVYVYKDRERNNGKCIPTLIIGAGKAGDMILREIQRNVEIKNKVVGFIDDDDEKVNKLFNQVKVLGNVSDINDVIKQHNVKDVFIAMPSASAKRISEVVSIASISKVKIKILPKMKEITSSGGKLHEKELRDVDINDLLGREPIELDTNGLYEFIDRKTVLVTGGGGSIGSEICRQVVKYSPSKLILFDIYENSVYDLQNELKRYFQKNPDKYKPELIVLIGSIRDKKRVEEVFNEYKPNIVFHAAAHKHVPLMEQSPKEAIKNNVFGSYHLCTMADKYKCDKFVLISTDKAVNPTNVMGASKRYTEIILQAFQNQSKHTMFSAVRFGNVLGSNGSVIPLFKKQIAEGGPVTVTHKDIIRYFMTIPEAASLVVQCGAFAKGGEKFILDMGEPVKIVDLAEKLINLMNYIPYEEVDIVFTGLRPGEKMYEELLLDTSNQIKTENDKIFIEQNNNTYTLEKVNAMLDKFSNMDVHEWVKEAVISYIPQT